MPSGIQIWGEVMFGIYLLCNAKIIIKHQYTPEKVLNE